MPNYLQTLPIRSISGIRGIVGKSIDAFEAYKTAIAFYEGYLKRHISKNRKVIISRDPRDSGNILLQGIFHAINEVKLEPIFLDIATLPITEWAVSHFKAIGGIYITASHNPIEWNGIKLISPIKKSAGVLQPTDAVKVISILRSLNKPTIKLKKMNFPPHYDIINEYYYNVIKKLKNLIDECADKYGYGETVFNEIRGRNFKVIIDTCCLEGTRFVKDFLISLGIPVKNLIFINTKKIENSDRKLEPRPEYLKNLKNAITHYKADIGFATDPDQDRFVAMPTKSEEHTPLLVGKFLFELQKTRKTKYINSVPVNLSTTSAWDNVAKDYGIKIIRTPVGEANIIKAMLENNAPIGFEGNGGVIYDEVCYCRNSTVGIGLLLAYLAYSGKNLSDLENELPQYYMIKTKIKTKNPQKLTELIYKHYQASSDVENINKADGYKIFFTDNSWIHIRPSNTEPIVRIVVETPFRTKKNAIQKLQKYLKEIEKIIPTESQKYKVSK